MAEVKAIPCLRSEHIVSYCTSKQIATLGVRSRISGQYYFYYFDKDTDKFYSLPCLECQPIASENELSPICSEWCEEIKDHIIHMKNQATQLLEQYRFCRSTGGLIQVNFPNLKKLVGDMRLPADVCEFPKTANQEYVVIQRNPLGFLVKLRHSPRYGRLVQIPAVPVRTLLMESLEKAGSKRINGADFYVGAICNHLKLNSHEGTSFVGVLCKGKPLWFYHDAGTFKPFTCSSCPGPATEGNLQFFYSRVHPTTGQTIFHAFNEITLRNEQFIYNVDTNGLEQVNYPELKYNPKFMHNSVLQVTQNKKNEKIIIMSAMNMRIMKSIFSEKEGKFMYLPAVPVKLLQECTNCHGTITEQNVESVDWLTANFQTVLVNDPEAQPSTSSEGMQTEPAPTQNTNAPPPQPSQIKKSKVLSKNRKKKRK